MNDIAPSSYVPVPIEAAARLADEFSKDQVIVVAWDGAHGRIHVTTWGRSMQDKAQAADGGNFVRKALGFPDDDCALVPGPLATRFLEQSKQILELDDIAHRAVRAAWLDGRIPRRDALWIAVRDFLCVGKTRAWELCRRFGYDPEHGDAPLPYPTDRVDDLERKMERNLTKRDES